MEKNNNIIEFSKWIQEPQFCLVKNIRFSDHENGLGDIVQGEVIHHGLNLKDIRKFIPIPKPITTEIALKRLIHREFFDYEFTLDEIDSYEIEDDFPEYNSNLDVKPQVANIFDNNPYYYNTKINQYYSETSMRDEYIFHESYVIIFLLTQNKDANEQFIKNEVDKLIAKNTPFDIISDIVIEDFLDELLMPEQELSSKYYYELSDYLSNYCNELQRNYY